MKLFLIILTWLLLLCGLLGEEQVEPEPTDGQIVLRPGFNAVAVTRFPLLGADGKLAESLTFPFVFGEANESGLQSGDPTTADLVWIHTGQGQWARFFYGKAISPTGEPDEGWRNVMSPSRDSSSFAWPYTAGMLIERRSDVPLVIPVKGVVRRTPTTLLVQKGTHYFNRVLDLVRA